MTADAQFVYEQYLNAIPGVKETSVVAWAFRNKIKVRAGRADYYDPDIAPWGVAPLECANDGTQKMTLIKPVQTGGSTVGEVALLFWMSVWASGNCSYYWQNDLAALKRWHTEFEKLMLACGPLMARTSGDRHDWKDALVILPHLNFQMRGVNTDRSVASDSFRGIVNEELHDVEGGWKPGRLEQTYARQTVFWNKVCFNISNAGFKHSDLHKAFLAGTQQHWEVKCPGCGLYHEMHCRWDKKKPELGGLRYDADGCRLGNYDYDYPKLVANGIFYEMPCGFKVRDDVTERKNLSRAGRYSEPKNKGALLTERSFTYEAVACDFVPWIDIIKRKHAARKSAEVYKDYKPWTDYLREVECQFVDLMKDRPAPERVTITTSERKKNREGLPNRNYRFAFADWQRGKDNDLPHFWLLIQDWTDGGDSLIVFEGRVDSENELVAILNEHGVTPISVAVDSGWDTPNIYSLCLRRGFNAVKSDDKLYWRWEDGTERFYDRQKPLFIQANAMPCRPDDPSSEPDFILYSKYVTMERLIYMQQSKEIKYEIPADVSDDFTSHFNSWTVEQVRQKDGQTVMKWRQTRDDDHLFQCAAGILPFADLAGIFMGIGTPQPPAENQPEPETVTQ